jgi:hypothetical protein
LVCIEETKQTSIRGDWRRNVIKEDLVLSSTAPKANIINSTKGT